MIIQKPNFLQIFFSFFLFLAYTMSDLSGTNDDILQNVDGVGTAMTNLMNRVAPVQPAM